MATSLGIERHYRREGRFPDRLQALIPEYLPCYRDRLEIPDITLAGRRALTAGGRSARGS